MLVRTEAAGIPAQVCGMQRVSLGMSWRAAEWNRKEKPTLGGHLQSEQAILFLPRES